MKTFLLVGQSNMAGRGRLEDVAPIHDSRIRMFRDGRWCEAVEPLHTDKPSIAGVGLGMSFAQMVLGTLPVDEEIGLIPCAVGGTPLSRWVPGADLYEQAVEIARAALADGEHNLAGILWHQGEGDSDELGMAETYAERLVQTIHSFRERFTAQECPVLCGTLGDFMAKREPANHAHVVNMQIKSLPQLLTKCQCVSAAGLGDNGDNLHFDAASLRTFGERYAAAYLSWEK